MKKSSIYLTDEERDRLKKLAKKEGRSQSEVIRSAIGSYADSRPAQLSAERPCAGGRLEQVRSRQRRLLLNLMGDL